MGDNPPSVGEPVGAAGKQDRRQIIAAGFDGYQPKPISVKSLLQAIREMLPSR